MQAGEPVLLRTAAPPSAKTPSAIASRAEGQRVLAERPWPTGWESWRPPAEWDPLELPEEWHVVRG